MTAEIRADNFHRGQMVFVIEFSLSGGHELPGPSLFLGATIYEAYVRAYSDEIVVVERTKERKGALVHVPLSSVFKSKDEAAMALLKELERHSVEVAACAAALTKTIADLRSITERSSERKRA